MKLHPLISGLLACCAGGIFNCALADGVTYQDNNNSDCSVVLNPAELVIQSDQKYKMNYLAISENDRGKVNVGVDVIGKVTGTLGLDPGKVSSTVNQTVEKSDYFFLAARWLTDSQLNAYVKCLEIEHRAQGLALYVKSWSNDQVEIAGNFQPGGQEPQTIKNFQSLITIQGALNNKTAVGLFPANLTNQQPIDVIIQRDPHKRFLLYVKAFKPINITLPILAEDPCAVVDQRTGICRVYYKALHLEGLSPSIWTSTFPAFKSNGATIAVIGKVTWSTNYYGTLGRAVYSWDTSGSAKRNFGLGDLPIDGKGSVPLGDSVHIAKFQSAVSVTIYPNSCEYVPPRTDPNLQKAQCAVDGVVFMTPDQ